MAKIKRQRAKQHRPFFQEHLTKKDLEHWYKPHWGISADNVQQYYIGVMPVKFIFSGDIDKNPVLMQRQCTHCKERFDLFDMGLRLSHPKVKSPDEIIERAIVRDQPQCPECRGRY